MRIHFFAKTQISCMSLYSMYVLQNGKQMVQEGALTALASVADSSQVMYNICLVSYLVRLMEDLV
jgi:hypothetical protein